MRAGYSHTAFVIAISEALLHGFAFTLILGIGTGYVY